MHSAHRTGWVMMVSRRIARSHQRQELISAKIKIAWLQTDVRFPQDIYSTRPQEALDSFSHSHMNTELASKVLPMQVCTPGSISFLISSLISARAAKIND